MGEILLRLALVYLQYPIGHLIESWCVC